VPFYFRGGVLHGVDCKKNGTWVRKAAYETFRKIPGAKFEVKESRATARGGGRNPPP